MKQHIDTAPVWDAYRKDCECPLCLLKARVEEANIQYFLGESVMEPDQRIEVNKKGFCSAHFKKLYDAGNRLGLALMADTHSREVIRQMKKHAEKIKKAAAEEAEKSVLNRIGSKKGSAMEDAVKKIGTYTDNCVMCERMEFSMERYMNTLMYMYRHEPEFPELFAKSKGMCLHHYRDALAAAPKYLSGKQLKSFVDTLVDLEIENFTRVEEEVEWFTRKFDFQNEDKPWGNSRDALKRTVNKLREQVIE